MATRSVTQDQLKELLHYDPETGVFTNKVTRNPRAKQGAIAGSLNTLGYVVIQISMQKIHAHRLAWLYVYGCWPKNQIDHINRIRNDNRLCNLRDVTSSENIHNTSDNRKNTSGYRGVTWNRDRGKWQAQIMASKQYFHLGLYDSPEEAFAVVSAKRRELHPTRAA